MSRPAVVELPPLRELVKVNRAVAIQLHSSHHGIIINYEIVLWVALIIHDVLLSLLYCLNQGLKIVWLLCVVIIMVPVLPAY